MSQYSEYLLIILFSLASGLTLGPAIFLFSEYWILFLLKKLAGISGAKIKNKWVYTSTYTPSWPKQGEN